MFRISNFLIGFLNFLTLIISLIIIGVSFFFHGHGHSECLTFLQIPFLTLGLFLLVVSLFGFIGSCARVSAFLWIYLFVMFLLIIGLFAFTIFAFVVTNKGVGKVISGRGFKEYRLGDYSHWLQNHVVNGKNWYKIRSCLIDARVCTSLGKDVVGQQAAQFYQKNLPPLQSGCCKPPTYCGFTYKNATFWEVPKSGPAAEDSDCTTWSNHQDTLCYDCKSCKAGILETIKKDWKKLSILNIALVIFLIVVYSIGCYALRNNGNARYKRYRGYA